VEYQSAGDIFSIVIGPMSCQTRLSSFICSSGFSMLIILRSQTSRSQISKSQRIFGLEIKQIPPMVHCTRPDPTSWYKTWLWRLTIKPAAIAFPSSARVSWARESARLSSAQGPLAETPSNGFH